MYKNQLQELAQRSCFNLPSYACIREGPDHAPRFKASVNFNGEIFESPTYCSTLRQAEHTAAEVALNALSSKGPSKSLTARILDETGIFKNLLQETAHRAGLNLPVYTSVRSGPGHVPTFTCSVELAGISFTGEPAKTKKQAEKNAAIAAWSSLKKMPILDSLANKEGEEKDQEIVARVLSSFKPKDDGRQMKRRDQNQARRTFKIYRDRNNSLLDQNWRLMNLLMDEGSSKQKQQTSFISFLPPPPPSTSSKMLPTTFPRNPPAHKPFMPLEIKGKLQVKFQDLIQKRQRDEQQLFGDKPEMIEKPTAKESPSSSISGAMYNPFPLSMLDRNIHHESTQSSNSRFLGSLIPFLESSNSDGASTAFYKGRGLYTGGFSLNPERIAPAVQVRSVIPVCAAPPPQQTKPMRPEPKPSVNETLTPCYSFVSISPKPGEKVSTAFGKPETLSSQLSSKMNKLQL